MAVRRFERAASRAWDVMLRVAVLCALVCMSDCHGAPVFWSVPAAPSSGPDMQLSVQVLPAVPGLGANATLVTVGNPVSHFHVSLPARALLFVVAD